MWGNKWGETGIRKREEKSRALGACRIAAGGGDSAVGGKYAEVMRENAIRRMVGTPEGRWEDSGNRRAEGIQGSAERGQKDDNHSNGDV